MQEITKVFSMPRSGSVAFAAFMLLHASSSPSQANQRRDAPAPGHVNQVTGYSDPTQSYAV
jgi:hypothetical protein